MICCDARPRTDGFPERTEDVDDCQSVNRESRIILWIVNHEFTIALHVGTQSRIVRSKSRSSGELVIGARSFFFFRFFSDRFVIHDLGQLTHSLTVVFCYAIISERLQQTNTRHSPTNQRCVGVSVRLPPRIPPHPAHRKLTWSSTSNTSAMYLSIVHPPSVLLCTLARVTSVGLELQGAFRSKREALTRLVPCSVLPSRRVPHNHESRITNHESRIESNQNRE